MDAGVDAGAGQYAGAGVEASTGADASSGVNADVGQDASTGADAGARQDAGIGVDEILYRIDQKKEDQEGKMLVANGLKVRNDRRGWASSYPPTHPLAAHPGAFVPLLFLSNPPPFLAHGLTFNHGADQVPEGVLRYLYYLLMNEYFSSRPISLPHSVTALQCNSFLST